MKAVNNMKLKIIFMLIIISNIFQLNTYAFISEKQQKEKDVEIIKNLEYSYVDNTHLLLDLYIPKSINNKPLPIVVWIHGGGWQNGDKNDSPLIDLTRYGFAIASIDYRLSGQAKFPAQIEDVMEAVSWLRTNAKKYNLNPKFIGAFGHSAGGHLAALLGTSGEEGSKIQAVCDLCGPTDFTKVFGTTNKEGQKYIDYENAVINLIGGKPEEHIEKVKAANPINHITNQAPPFLLIHGNKDMVVPYSQSMILFDALITKGLKAEIIIAENQDHGLDFEADNKKLVVKIVKFFRKYLREQK